MPHLKLEHSTNTVETPIPAEFFSRLHSILADSGPFALENIKSRVVSHENYFIAEGDSERAFIHLEVAILAGPEEEVLKHVSARMLEFLKDEFKKTASKNKCSFSVEIRQMRRETYCKETTSGNA
jgi:5-carboxymethyl-2-hydroxymuconate isomerase